MQHDALPTHPTTGLRALGRRMDGRLIWPIAGAAEDDGGQQGQGQQTGQQAGSLLEEQSQQGGQQGGQQTEENGTGEQQGQQAQVDMSAIVSQVTQALESRFDSIADRRVNAILREVRGQAQGGQPAGGNTGEQGGQGQGQQQSSQQPPDRSGDLREARLAYREYVADEIRFLGNEEREHAMTLAQSLLAGRIAQGEDPETAGREVARTVATQVKAMRSLYETQTVAALRRRGALPADGRGEGQPLPGGNTPGGTQAAGYAKGQQKAAEMFPDRRPQPAQTT